MVRPRPVLAGAPTGFRAVFQECFGSVLPDLPQRRGRRPRVPPGRVLAALVFHVMNAAGTLAEHFGQRFEEALADSSLSERRPRLPWEVFTELMRVGLRPLRARMNIQVPVVQRFKDGSRLGRVPVRQKGRPRLITQWRELREIRGRGQRPGHRAQAWRLGTSLLDPRSAPATELRELYARRWEHELYDRELKHQLRKSEALQSHTLETGAQEIAAVVLATARRARERARAAAGQTPVLRVSFVKTLELLRPLWLTLALGGELLSARQKPTIDRPLSGTSRPRCDTAPPPTAQLSARGAPASERLAAPPTQPIVERPGPFQNPLTMNSRKALGLMQIFGQMWVWPNLGSKEFAFLFMQLEAAGLCQMVKFKFGLIHECKAGTNSTSYLNCK